VLILSIAKALVEIAAMSMAAQLLVGLFSPSNREANLIYRLFTVVTQPVNRVVRYIMPRFVLNEHIPFASLFVLAMLWLGLLMLKVQWHV
jgi:uncharacterized protein YggT (Ycf19 family)